jgi:hypothetical protein
MGPFRTPGGAAAKPGNVLARTTEDRLLAADATEGIVKRAAAATAANKPSRRTRRRASFGIPINARSLRLDESPRL